MVLSLKFDLPTSASLRSQRSAVGLAAVAMLMLALLPVRVLAGEETASPALAPVKPQASAAGAADVDVVRVPVADALRLLAEIYDLSLVTVEIPDSTVTLRLRGTSAEDALDALALAAGLEVEARGAVYFVRPRGEASEVVSRLVPGSPPTRADHAPEGGDLAWLEPSGVEARHVGDSAVLLEGPSGAVEGASLALALARRARLEESVYPLGTAGGEDTLAAVLPLLDPELETAAYDPEGHRLTLSALPETLARAELLLEELTRTPAQFEIEVRLVEISTRAIERMGAQGFFRLQVTGGLLPTTFPLDGVGDAARYLPSPNDLAALSEMSSAGGSGGGLGDTGFSFGQIDGRGIGLLIELLEQSGDAKVVASPKVTTLDNRQARLSMVTTLRIPTFTQNQAFSTTTVSGIETVDVGTTLDVRPRKSRDRQIFLTVTPEVSELEPDQEIFSQNGLTQGLPVISRRRTETEVVLEAGETLVISGLTRERLSNTLGKTPGLGDLPGGLGRAFQHRGETSESTELLVFLTPRELPPPAERRGLTPVDGVWIPKALAQRVEHARAALASPATRLAALSAFEKLDAELLTEGVDLASDVVRLGSDPDLGARVAAALFFLRSRPEMALLEITHFRDNRRVALGALEHPMAPHVRQALGELIVHSESGAEVLEGHYSQLAGRGEWRGAGRLLETLRAVDPERAARLARRAEAAAGLEPRLRLEALGGDSQGLELLASLAGDALSMEERAIALAALAGPRGAVPGPGPASIPEGEILRASRPLPGGRDVAPRVGVSFTEPALGWSGEPPEIEILGASQAAVERVRRAVDLLAARAPDLRHLVGFALATVEAAEGPAAVDPRSRFARVSSDLPAERLAPTLVRLASLVFEERVRGNPADSASSLARAVRLEIKTLERLTGAPCPPTHAAAAVGRVLVTAALDAGDRDG